MKTLFQSATLLGALALAAFAVLNFPVGAEARGQTHSFDAPPHVFVNLLTNGKSDRLGTGWIVAK